MCAFRAHVSLRDQRGQHKAWAALLRARGSCCLGSMPDREQKAGQGPQGERLARRRKVALGSREGRGLRNSDHISQAWKEGSDRTVVRSTGWGTRHLASLLAPTCNGMSPSLRLPVHKNGVITLKGLRGPMRQYVKSIDHSAWHRGRTQ